MELVLKFTKLGSGLAEIVYHKALEEEFKIEISIINLNFESLFFIKNRN
jgi:hypothetical protein